MTTARIVIGMLLMAASNGGAWYMVQTSSTKHSLSETRSAVWKIALFYALWAVYNNLVLGRGDLGYISFGILTAVCLLTDKLSCTKLNRLLLVVACALVALNFAVVFPMISAKGGVIPLAEATWGDDSALTHVWAYVFVTYIGSNVLLWPYCGYLFVTLPLKGSGGVDNPRVEDADLYEPIESESEDV